ncbi:type IV toxin-antitoxin system AbiEi family antitoxin [bacterium]|nr:type IV toxin-antitoxin system AbiEi family antitoxin [bacterium]
MIENRQAFSSYMTHLLSTGRIVFSREEAHQALGVSHGALLDAAERQQRKGHLLNPRRGFYVIIPPQYLALGAPPPSWYVDDLMRHEGRPYYVSLLKAAELHGATHQAVMEFQVITDIRLPKIRAGRSAIVFYYRKAMAAVDEGIEDRQTDTGHMRISCVELTVLDLIRYPRAAGGLDNVATIIADLGDRIDPGKLAVLSSAFERSVSQRLGYLLERSGHIQRSKRLHKTLSQNNLSLPWVELEPRQADPGSLVPQERNERWHVIVRRLPEVDE